MLLTNQNSIQKEIKFRLKAGNSCYYSSQRLLPSRFPSKDMTIKIYKTTILLVMVYGCETSSLILREECSLRVLENRFMRRMFGPKRDENGEWRMLHNEELHSLYCSPHQFGAIKSRNLRLAGHVARMEEGSSAFKFLTGKPTGKSPLGRPRLIWEDNIRMDLEEININAGN